MLFVIHQTADVTFRNVRCIAENATAIFVYTQFEGAPGGRSINKEKPMLPKAKLVSPIVMFLAISSAQAHVTVQPKESTAGATQKYTMRVPNEKSIANVRVEAEFPANAEIISVEEKAGWTIEVKKDASGKISGAVWSGMSLAPRDIVEFGISVRNPNEETKLVWKVVQVFEDGSRAEWTGPQGKPGPAPVTQIKPQ